MLGSPAIVANGWLVDARAIAITKALSKGSTTYDTCGFSTPQCCASLKELACGAAARTLAIDAGITAGSCQLESQSVSYSTCIASE